MAEPGIIILRLSKIRFKLYNKAMPYTPYHFGPSGFFGLVFKKWIDLPVFVLANVIIDVEVLFAPGLLPHRHWYFHSLLIGGIVGVVFALCFIPARPIIKKIMTALKLPYKSGILKLVLSGILGAWFHVLVDAVYHWDVQIFWPYAKNPLYNIISRSSIKTTCLYFWLAAVLFYLFTIRADIKSAITKCIKKK